MDKKKATCSLHNSVTKELDVAMEVIADQQKPDMDLSLALGASYKVDDTSNIKGKVDKAGVINLCYTQKARKDLEMKVTAAINTGNLSGATAHKWGMSLSRLPLCHVCLLPSGVCLDDALSHDPLPNALRACVHCAGVKAILTM